MKKIVFAKAVLLFLVALHQPLCATHIRAGDIRYERIAPFNEWRFLITVTKYFNTGPQQADRCVDSVFFGDGTKGLAQRANGPTCGNCGEGRCGEDLSGGLSVNIYTIAHTFPVAGDYTITSVDYYRSPGYNNIYSANHAFYITAYLRCHPSFSNDRSAGIYYHPILFAGMSCYTHTPMFDELDGDSLQFEVVKCLGKNGTPIADYVFPDSGPGGSFGFQGRSLVWCSPQAQGVYAISYRIKEYRNENGTWHLIGWVQRDQDAIVYAGPTGLETAGAPPSFEVFPNPSEGRLKIRTGGTGPVSLRVFDLRGAEVLPVTSFDGERHELDLGETAPGLYLVQIEQNGYRQYRRVVIRRD